jgi:hypothetical protein
MSLREERVAVRIGREKGSEARVKVKGKERERESR